MPLHLSSQTQNETDPCLLPGATERVYSNAYKARTSPVASSETHGRALFASAGFLIAVIPLSNLFLTLLETASSSDLCPSPLRIFTQQGLGRGLRLPVSFSQVSRDASDIFFRLLFVDQAVDLTVRCWSMPSLGGVSFGATHPRWGGYGIYVVGLLSSAAPQEYDTNAHPRKDRAEMKGLPGASSWL